MAMITFILLSPLLLIISIPLTVFAAITTFFAFCTLSIRASVVYIDLAAALLQNVFHSPSTLNADIDHRELLEAVRASPKKRAIRQQKSRPGSATSFSSAGDTSTPKASGSRSLITGYDNDSATRDFEGVGGWRLAAEDEDVQWMNLNSRLELPIAVAVDGNERHHHRSRTSGSLTAVSLPSRSPTLLRGSTPTSARGISLGTGDDYFGSRDVEDRM